LLDELYGFDFEFRWIEGHCTCHRDTSWSSPQSSGVHQTGSTPEGYLAPVPQLLWGRVLEGAIWDIVEALRVQRGNEHAGRPALDAMGDAVERYVETLLIHRYGADNVHPECRAYAKQGQRGADFAVIDRDEVVMIEVKSAVPTLPLSDSGDVESLTSLLRRSVAEPLRKLPAKEVMLLSDPWLRCRLPNGPTRVIHVVVTLGAFPAQVLWWKGVLTPLLVAGPTGTEGPSYDITHPHHLMSLDELEDATADEMPRLANLLRRTWYLGPGHELAEVLRTVRPPLDQRQHSVLDPLRDQWRAQYGRVEEGVTSRTP